VLDSYDRGEEHVGTVTRIATELAIGPESLRRWVVQNREDRPRVQYAAASGDPFHTLA
jgi:transposase-like protein